VKRTPLAKKGTSDTALIKEEIQNYVRAIVIIRDGGCIARNEPWHTCNGYRNHGELILQADHFITRGTSATYADTRLIVCICKGLHGWKKWNEKEYNERIRPLIGPKRCALWDRCHAARYTPTRMYASDWKKELAALKQEFANTKPMA
jgi:hypothetical protein